MAGPACYVSSLEAGERRGALSAPSAYAASVGLEHVYECQHSGGDAEDDRECGRDSRGGGQDHPDCDDDDGDRREGLWSGLGTPNHAWWLGVVVHGEPPLSRAQDLT